MIGWLVIGGGAILTPISVISCLMVLAPHHGDWAGTVMDWLIVVAAPPASLVAGIGLLRRHRWARVYLLLLFGMILVINCVGILRGPTPTSQHTSPSGLSTTVLGSESHGSLFAMGLSALGIVVLLAPKVGAEFRATRSTRSTPLGIIEATTRHQIPGGDDAMSPPLNRSGTPDPRAAGGYSGDAGWRVGHRGRDQMYYEEFLNERWQRIEIDGEMLMGRAHHVIYFASAEGWQSYPGWAQHRRDEIIARLKSKFRPPDYEYFGEDPATSPGAFQHRGPLPPIRSQPLPPQLIALIPRAREFRSALILLLTAAALLCVTGAMIWRVGNGLDRGEIPLPTKTTSQARTISRQQEPALFFVSVGIYSVLGLGTLGLAVWGLKVAFQPRR